MTDALSPAKRRILDLLKRLGPTPATTLAERLSVTGVAIRQHLATLESHGLVEPTLNAPSGRGRPSTAWSLTSLAAEAFPDRHADLTVSLIQATRDALGEKGMKKVIAQRSADQLAEYRELLPGAGASLKKRVEALADQRSTEGYMAEVRTAGRGAYLLIEHHCPICDAAKTCQGLCASELDVFRGYFGDNVTVERIEHVLGDGDRCAYEIRMA